MSGTGGTLSSMGYPGSYSNGARCQWSIQVPLGKVVHLHFHNFSLEESQLCMNDKVTDRVGSLGMQISTSFLSPADADAEFVESCRDVITFASSYTT